MKDYILSPLEFELSLWLFHYNERLNAALNTNECFYCGPVIRTHHDAAYVQLQMGQSIQAHLQHHNLKTPHLRSEDRKLWLEIPSVTVFLKDTKCSIEFSQKFRDLGGKPVGLRTTRTFFNMSKDMQLTVSMFSRCIALKLLKSSSTSLNSVSKKVLRRYNAVVLTL